MAEQFQLFQMSNLSGGMNTNVGEFQKNEDESDLIRNGQTNKIGWIQKRLGYATQRGDDVNTGYKILGMHSFYPTSGLIRQYAVADGASNSDVYTYNPATNDWTPHVQALTTASKCEFTTFLDRFYRVNYTEATASNNGTAWSTTVNVTGAPLARYITPYLNRLYLGNCQVGATEYPSRVYFSSLPDPTTSLITWDTTSTGNWFEVDPDDGDVVKGLGVNANRLLVFKENSLHRYDTNTRYQVPGCPGTVSQRTVKNIQGFTLYLHSSGVWAYDGASSILVSRSIQPYIDGMSSISLGEACAYVKGDHYYCFIGNVINSKEDINEDNVLLDLDISKKAWTIHNLADIPTIFIEFRDDRSEVQYDASDVTYNSADITYDGGISAESRTYIGTKDGQVWQFLNGNSDGGTPIRFEIITREIYLENRDAIKNLYKLFVYTRKGTSLIVQFKIDGGEWKNLGPLNRETTELRFPPGTRCRKVQLRFSEYTTAQQPTLEALSIYYKTETLTR